MSKRKFTATFLSKGQLTIPKYVRDKLKLKPGEKIDVQAIEGEAAFIGRPQRG